MYLLEIENHKTENKAIVQAKDENQAHEKLVALGYDCISYGELYAGFDENGAEISVMPVHIPHVASVKAVNLKKKEGV